MVNTLMHLAKNRWSAALGATADHHAGRLGKTLGEDVKSLRPRDYWMTCIRVCSIWLAVVITFELAA
jgi:hypothetical protein